MLVGLGYACGRPVDVAAGLGLCADHTAERTGVERRKRPYNLAPRPPKPPCECGETKIYAKGACLRCYQNDYQRRRYHRQRAALLPPGCTNCGDAKVTIGGQCQKCWRASCRQSRLAAWATKRRRA